MTSQVRATGSPGILGRVPAAGRRHSPPWLLIRGCCPWEPHPPCWAETWGTGEWASSICPYVLHTPRHTRYATYTCNAHKRKYLNIFYVLGVLGP